MQAECIAVLCNLAIGKTHIGLYLIHHLPSCFGKSIGGYPVAGTVLLIQVLNVAIGERKIFCILTKHFPHAFRLIAPQEAKCGVKKNNIVAVAGRHAGCIKFLKGRIKIIDELVTVCHDYTVSFIKFSTLICIK